ncbi:lipopolysaccharide-induced tumor necrosis factor-alpha factor homolog isoform X2 [Orussus abietinus]|uniref:lipopolysaccharide-induced tumor necrosis factor-alpha factor homolog isoform X2 n=1 Tax=Orussus abietinus TaxID=222816 RepID=UPI000626155D|nr:lipopolysaccharide-induced tumor necrosis factor-alpha factor homolog isoform X2 [Orussus abietinus]
MKDMEKNQGNPSSSNEPSAPPLLAPPSYEEAIAQFCSSGTQNVPTPAPYPVQAPITRPPDGRQKDTNRFPQPPYNPPQTFTAPSEVRVVHHHVSYILGSNPVKMTCPTCHMDIKTTTVSDHQPSAHICCIVLCLLGCCLCSCLPYCMSAFLSVHHFCPNCKTYIGTWKG